MEQPLKVTIGAALDGAAFGAFSWNGETPLRMALVRVAFFLENCIVDETGNSNTREVKNYLGNSGLMRRIYRFEAGVSGVYLSKTCEVSGVFVSPLVSYVAYTIGVM